MERIAPSGVRLRTLRIPVDPDAVASALLCDGPASVWSDPSGGGDRFIGFAAGPDDLLVVEREDDRDTFAHALRARLTGAADSALLGWWGLMSYEFGVTADGLPIADDDVPLASFAFVDRGIVLAADELVLIAVDRAPDAEEWLDVMEARILALARAPVPEPAPPPPSTWRWRHDRTTYLELIAACQAAIRRGDAYQLCLTNTITVDTPAPPDPLAVYRRLRALTPTAHSGVLRVGDRWLLSTSPEQFLHVDRAGAARTRPMKGTRPRSTDAAVDRGLAADLLASDKERAENLMIVDLMRNDLSRVSRVGSVAVTELFSVETFGFSHQLVSTVESVLETDPVAAVLALFPAGSMSGAPKHAAMRILGELEVGPRGAYSGVWGRLSLDGSVDLAVVIRSIVLEGDRVLIARGGGITAQSDPAAEWDEVVLKARSMLLAIGADPDAEERRSQ